MAIITLTTDLGLKDYYVASVKGSIYKLLPEVQIVDISHIIPAFNIQEAAYVLQNSYPFFPEGTVHIIGVNAECTEETPHICLLIEGQYFIGADNGIFSLLFEKKPDKVVELTISPDKKESVFPVRDVFTKAACHLARGGAMDLLGNVKKGFNERILFKPIYTGNSLRGTVIYIDSFNNVVTNITESLIQEASQGRSYFVSFGGRNEINTISKAYTDVQEGELLAMFNAAGQLEIAMNHGKASQMLFLHVGDSVSIMFET